MKRMIGLFPRLALGVGVVLATVFALAPTMQSAFRVEAASGVQSLGASVPLRVYQIDEATRGVFEGNRAAQLQPGYPAALAAIFPSSSAGGFDIYRIDPTTGSGSFYMQLPSADINAALQEAARTGRDLLIVPSGGQFTREQLLGQLPQVYALAAGDCGLLTAFPDGKPAQFIFDC